MSDIACPYCNAEMEICHDDGFGCEEDVAHEMECHKCDKSFVFHTSIIFLYNAAKADCLNGAHHPYGEWRRKWDHNGVRTEYRRCRDCDKTEDRQVAIP